MRSRVLATLAVLLLAAGTSAARGENVRATRADFPVVVAVDGRIEPAKIREIRLLRRALGGTLVVRECLPPGARVVAGQVVLRFEDEEAAFALHQAEAELAAAREDLGLFERQAELAARTAHVELTRESEEIELARTRFEVWRKAERPNAEEQDRLEEESQVQSLQNARDELAQLEAMYEEDELVDDTEEIVLQRARWDVARREAVLALGRRIRALRAEHERPLHERNLERDLDRRVDALSRRRDGLEIEARRREMELERLRRTFEERRRRHELLLGDVRALAVIAPADGMLLHGPYAGAATRRHEPGDVLSGGEAIATVIDPSAAELVLPVPERHALALRPGLSVRVIPAAAGAAPVEGVVATVAPIAAGGTIEVRVRLADATPAALLGTPAKGEFLLDVRKGALVLPLSAVRREGSRATVNFVGADGVRAVEVRLGPDDGSKVVIEEGLAEGDLVEDGGAK